jgi:hypothetical protein
MGDRLHMKRSAGDPFDVRLEVPVAGGALSVARSGPPPLRLVCELGGRWS